MDQIQAFVAEEFAGHELSRLVAEFLKAEFFRVRVWDADHLLKAVLRNYDRLSEDLRADLPLKRIWSLVVHS